MSKDVNPDRGSTEFLGALPRKNSDSSHSSSESSKSLSSEKDDEQYLEQRNNSNSFLKRQSRSSFTSKDSSLESFENFIPVELENNRSQSDQDSSEEE